MSTVKTSHIEDANKVIKALMEKGLDREIQKTLAECGFPNPAEGLVAEVQESGDSKRLHIALHCVNYRNI